MLLRQGCCRAAVGLVGDAMSSAVFFRKHKPEARLSRRVTGRGGTRMQLEGFVDLCDEHSVCTVLNGTV